MKAILFVSFGTIHLDAYQAAIEPLVEDLKQQTGLPVYQAITSRFVKRKLDERQVDIASLEQALEHLVQDGVKDVTVVNNFVMPAIEYQRMKHLVFPYRKHFKVRFTPAVLEHLSDQIRLVETLEELYAQPGQTLYLLGHGSRHPSGAILSQLQLLAEERGFDHIYQSIDGYPDAAVAMRRLAPGKPVVLVPLLYVAGTHGKHDLAELANTLHEAGHPVTSHVVGLGEQAAIRQLTLQYV